MSIIYSFLQKRKMHESQYGFAMVFIAYALSALMLALGSDVFYNINTAAAGISTDTKEETQVLLNVKLPYLQSANYTAQVNETDLINPYDLAETSSEISALSISEGTSTSGDTIWVFGNAIDGKAFDSIMEQVSSLDSMVSTMEKTDDKEVQAKKTTTKIKAKETVSTAYSNVTNKEVAMLERIVEAEASGEDMVGKILVANVILNRAEDDSFPDTIKGVIFQESNGEYQFSPISDERYWSVEVSTETKKAVKRALDGEDYSEGALYFIARKRTNSGSAEWFDDHLDWLFKHGGHEFYKNK
ncbi:MAG: cell wall hydrolase [Herbinix sp.]|nr:cell wall hydrolase [Herbinix sp.]